MSARALRLSLTSTCVVHPLLLMSLPTGRIVSVLIMKSPCCDYYTVIHGCVLSVQAVYLQTQLALGFVSGDTESAFPESR
jgi:hypothetical protein